MKKKTKMLSFMGKKAKMSFLKAIRTALGFSTQEMASLLWMDGADDELMRQVEKEEDCPGPVFALLRYISQGVDIEGVGLSDFIGDVLPRWLDCTDLEDESNNCRLVLHTRYPRFYGVFLTELPDEDLIAAAGFPVVRIEGADGFSYLIVLFIDDPIRNPKELIEQCARLKINRVCDSDSNS